jgi:hypothetical protein
MTLSQTAINLKGMVFKETYRSVRKGDANPPKVLIILELAFSPCILTYKRPLLTKKVQWNIVMEKPVIRINQKLLRQSTLSMT